MQRRTVIVTAAIAAGIALWYAFRPERLFVNTTVSESFEGVAAPNAPTTLAMSRASENTDAPTAIANGEFHSNAHETKGTATIYAAADGKRVLRLTGFSTSNGPDVRVYLVAAPDVNDNSTVASAGFVELGALKGNRGDQNYELPAATDLSKFRTVTIWCRRFSVNFGSAPLTETRS